MARGHVGMQEHAGLAILAGCCLATILFIHSGPSPSVLVGRGVLYGFHPDEMAVAPTEEKSAMDTLVKSEGGQVVPADISAKELKRWITPFFNKKLEERKDLYGNKRVPSAVDFENRRIDLISEADPRVSQHFKAAFSNSLPVKPIIRKGTQPDFFSASHPEISAAKATDKQKYWDEWAETAARPPKIPIHVANQQADFFKPTSLATPKTESKVENQQADFFAATAHHPTYESATKHERKPKQPASLLTTAQRIFDATSARQLHKPSSMLSAAQASLDSRSYAARARFTELAATPEKQLPPSWVPLFQPDREHGYWGAAAPEMPDAFAPNEPWNSLRENKKMAFAFADLERECLAAGKGHTWDDEQHQCLFDGAPIPKEDAEPRWGPLDYQTVDLQRECEAAAAAHDGYRWDKEARQCLFWGKPAQAAEQAGVRPLAYKYQDLKHDCEQRGPEYHWAEAAVDGEVGDCFKFTEQLRQAPQEERWAPLDYLQADRRVACEKKGWVWGRDGSCSQYGQGLADQDGYRREKRTAGRKASGSYALESGTLPSSWAGAEPPAAATPATVVGDKELPVMFADFKALCAKKRGVYKEVANPERAVCLSQWECSVIDQHGREDHNCARAGMENLWGSKVIAANPARELHRDKFNPGGSQVDADAGATPPLSIASSVVEAQTGQPRPLAFQDADLHGKDLGALVQARPAGRGWTEGVNHANGSDKYYYNHRTGQIAWRGPSTRPEQCTDEVNGTGEVAGCDWERSVDVASGEQFWTNRETGKRTWQNPFDDKYPAKPALALPSRKGTWSGVRGGNPYWTPERAQAELGGGYARVLNARGQRLPNCGGSSGMCMGYAEGGSGPAEPPDAFNPQSSMKGEPLRGARGGEWDRAQAKAEAGEGEGASAEEKGREESLADVYGVRVTDDVARKYFDQDDGAEYQAPSHESTMAYVRYLAKHPYKAAKGGAKEGEGTAVQLPTDADFEPEAEDEEEGDGTKWPEKPKFGEAHKTHSREEWCNWAGGGGLEVRCAIGIHGAWPEEPASEGIWGHTEENTHTMVGWGAWKIPKAARKHHVAKLPQGALQGWRGHKAWAGQRLLRGLRKDENVVPVL